MIETGISYVFQTAEGGWRLTDSRVSLDSIVHGYWQGQTPEAIQADFPSLSLEQIHGAIAFYLRNREKIDRYMAATAAMWERLRQDSEAKHGPLFQQLRERLRDASHRGGRP